MILPILVLPPPCPASHVRIGKTWSGRRVGFHEDEYGAWRLAAEMDVRRQWRGASIPAHTPVILHIDAVSARPEKKPDWCPAAIWKAGCRLWRPVRPDAENFGEAVADALQVPKKLRKRAGVTGYPLADDGQVVDLRVRDVVAALGEQAATYARIVVLPDVGCWEAA